MTYSTTPPKRADGGTTVADRAERIERVDELRPQLAEHYDFATDENPECTECGTTDDVDLDPGLSLDDFQYRCVEHKRLRVKFWLVPGPHPSMPSPENLFTCDACDEEFVFPYGVYAVERWDGGRHEYHEHRCLECATLEWLRRFCTETNRMDGYEAMCEAVDDGEVDR